MSNPERPEGGLAPWSPSPLVASPAAAWEADLGEAAPPKMFSPRSCSAPCGGTGGRS